MVSLQGERLRALRTEWGLNQAELAEKLGINHYQISRYERNTGNPSIDTLVAMAQFFNTTVDYLLGLSDVPTPTNPNITPPEAEMLAFMRQFDIDTQRRMLRAIMALYEAWCG